MKSKEEIIAKYNFICDPDVLETVEAMMEEYQQSQPSGMRWVREKPANDREFVLVTASLINGEWHYHGWEIIEVPDGYFALCELHGEEWGPYEDLSAEYYLVLSPVSESYPAGAAEGASEGMAEALAKFFAKECKVGDPLLSIIDSIYDDWKLVYDKLRIETSFSEAAIQANKFVIEKYASLSPGVEDNQTKKQ